MIKGTQPPSVVDISARDSYVRITLANIDRCSMNLLTRAFPESMIYVREAGEEGVRIDIFVKKRTYKDALKIGICTVLTLVASYQLVQRLTPLLVRT